MRHRNPERAATDRHEGVVVGGVQAGLAIAYFLTRQGPGLTTQPNIGTKHHDATPHRHRTPRPLPHRHDGTSRMPPSGDHRASRRRHARLEIWPVAKQLGDATVRMLSYNGSIPGPTLKVAQGSEVEVNVINQGDLEATVHWHGLRLENRYDGTHETQAAIPSARASRHA
jgi:FtsP/CotA-like multicopper oxidase with cupredoxin domain